MSKRLFDLTLAVILLILLSIPLLLIYIVTSIDLKENGFFFQKRIGQYSTSFIILKFKTIHSINKTKSNWGDFLRSSKIDELPQLVNILKGQMSFVGPRPDIEGYYDKLEGENRKILELKPGLTSDAAIKYANEEELLYQKENPLDYYDSTIFPDKVKMNLEYYFKQSILLDLQIILKTIFR